VGNIDNMGNIDNVENIDSTTGQGTDGNMAHAHFTMYNKDHKHTLTTCNTYCFSTAKMVA
jgi:hypothetical protein